METPGISTGYWKARKTPCAARSSGARASRSRPCRDLSGGDVVAFPPGENVGQRALSRAVRSHDRVHFAGIDLEVDPPRDFAPADRTYRLSILSIFVLRSLHRRSADLSRRCLRG